MMCEIPDTPPALWLRRGHPRPILLQQRRQEGPVGSRGVASPLPSEHLVFDRMEAAGGGGRSAFFGPRDFFNFIYLFN